MLAIASATTVSRRVKPCSRTIGDTHSAGQPIDADIDAPAVVHEHDAAAGGAAVGVETDVGDALALPLIGDCPQFDAQFTGNVTKISRADAVSMAGQVDADEYRAIAGDRLRSRQAQIGGELRRDARRAESLAPR